MIEADYLVVGAGAMGMAFTDVLITETDARVVLVDRLGRPGGHWNHAYPHVRLHQPSSFYGVNSRPLGGDTTDATGWNAGLFELASGAEVLAYFDQVLNQQFLPSGRVTYLPMHDHVGDATVTSLASGDTHDVAATTIVDATYMEVTVPAMRPPPYEVADGATCVPPNALTSLDRAPDRFVVVGAGKTAIDACLWLLATGVGPDAITWIMPRDSWLLDRATIQPGAEFFDASVGGFAHQVEAAALADSVDDLFERLEATGQLMRLDPSVRPRMYRCATVTVAELEQLRRIDEVVRLGHVTSIGPDEIVLDDGTIATTPGTLHVDCTADGLARRPPAPVFDGTHITLQTVRTCQQVFSAALIGHVEAVGGTESEKNDMCTVVPHPDSDIDWLSTTLGNLHNMMRWQSDPAMAAWLADARLDAFSGATDGGSSPAELALLGRILEHLPQAIENLADLVVETA